MVYKDFKDLPRRTASDKLLHDRALNVSSDPRYDRYQRDDRYQRYQLASMVYKIFHTKPRVTNTHTGARIFLRINNWLINYSNSSLENARGIKHTLFIDIIFGLQSWYTCS